MRKLVVVLLLIAAPAGGQTVTMLHFSDYHSQAVPFYGERGADQGGIARAIRYLAREKARGALVFNGGDMINKGAPAWSDKYGCAEWPWLNGVADVMAFGNHDADYGLEAFRKCRAMVSYPILSANTPGFDRYVVLKAKGKRIGVFAVAGPDFPRLVHVDGLTFGDSVAAAREAVRDLREKERVDAVVMIGHEHAEADYELARAVPGIDVIFGTHSHLLRELTQIPGTSTWFISPFQYLSYISRIEMTFAKSGLTVRGRLVPVDRRLGEDRQIALRVRGMQVALEQDPGFRELFVPVGRLRAPLTVEQLAVRTLDVMRKAAGAEIALSTVSSFRRPLPSGLITMELLRASLPYDNEIVVCTMRGDVVQRVLAKSEKRKGSDSHSYVSAPAVIDGDRNYRVATTDYLATVAYRDVFQCELERMGRKVREMLLRDLF